MGVAVEDIGRGNGRRRDRTRPPGCGARAEALGARGGSEKADAREKNCAIGVDDAEEEGWLVRDIREPSDWLYVSSGRFKPLYKG